MSDEVLFTDAELFTGDPLNPDCEQVCPPSVIAELTAPRRRWGRCARRAISNCRLRR
jgi:hypothetical protein